MESYRIDLGMGIGRWRGGESERPIAIPRSIKREGLQRKLGNRMTLAPRGGKRSDTPARRGRQRAPKRGEPSPQGDNRRAGRKPKKSERARRATTASKNRAGTATKRRGREDNAKRNGKRGTRTRHEAPPARERKRETTSSAGGRQKPQKKRGD